MDLQAVAAEKAAFLGGLSHAEVPFPKLVEALDVPRSPMHTPIFQAIVAINETVSASCNTLQAVEVLAVVREHSHLLCRWSLALALSLFSLRCQALSWGRNWLLSSRSASIPGVLLHARW